MITANELRIGNKVLGASRGGVETVPGSMIAQIEDRKVNVNPIELTPEILEKAGFAKRQGDFHFQNVIFLRQAGVYFIAKFYVDASCFASSLRRELIVRDVHQLQNLYYALTGTELIIL